MINQGTTYSVPPSLAIRIEVVQELSLLDALAKPWSTLLLKSKLNRVFSSAAWYIQSCQQYSDLHPYVLLAYRDEQLSGILPLVWNKATNTAHFANRLSDYNDLICEEGDIASAVALVKKILSPVHPFEYLDWIRLRPDSYGMMAFEQLGMQDVVAPFFIDQSVCPYLTLSAGANYPASKKFRQHLAWCKRAAARAGIGFKSYEVNQANSKALITDFLQLHKARFGTHSPLVEAHHQSFIQALFPQLLEMGRLQLFALEDQGEAIAMQLYMSGANSLCYWNGGWQSDYKRYSPGNLLLFEIIQWAQASGYQEVDFLRGQEAYKSRWTNGQRHLGNLYFDLNALAS